MTGTAPTLAQVVAALDRRYPPATAESWDAVGLVCGDPAQPVRRVLLAVDPVAAVVDAAVEAGVDLVVAKHPLLLRAVHGVAATDAKGAVVHRLVRAGIALHVVHTNSDGVADGGSQALADALGLAGTRPLAPAPDGPLDEPPGWPGATGAGRVGELPGPVTLRAFAETVARVLPATAQGIRYAGDPEARVRRVAVLNGSGDSFFAAVRASGADVYLTSDLRHHPVSEAREQAVFAAGGSPDGRPFLVDAAHAATEWPWLARAADLLVSDLAAAGTTVETLIGPFTDPWTGRVDTPHPTGGPAS